MQLHDGKRIRIFMFTLVTCILYDVDHILIYPRRCKCVIFVNGFRSSEEYILAHISAINLTYVIE